MKFCGTERGAAMTAQTTYRAAIGRRIADARSRAGINQADLADACGVAERTIREWESGRAMPPADALGAMCSSLRCSADWIVGRPRSDSAAIYALNARTEALLLSSDVIDAEWEDRWSRVGTMLDEATDIVSMEEFLQRLLRIRLHRGRLLPPNPGGNGERPSQQR